MYLPTINNDNLWFIILFFVPGFVSIKVYDLLVPNKDRKFKDFFFDAFVFSAANSAAFFWLIEIYKNPVTNPIAARLSWAFVIFIAPIFWSLLFIKLSKLDFFKNYLRDPISNAWDWHFSKRQKYWVRITLKDDSRIAGFYAENSFASSFPAKEQIFLEDVWTLNDDDGFDEKKEQTAGILISGDEIKTMEFYK